MSSTTEKRAENEQAVLRLLNDYGYLRMRDLAFGIWGSDASDQMARRTLARLREDGLVSEKREPNGCLVFALSVKGANRLRKLGLASQATASLLNRLGNFAHRCRANEICLCYAQYPENRVYTEHQIQAGKHPIAHSFHKVPDYFVETPFGCVWGEVENSRRSPKDFAKLLRWLRVITQHQPDMLPALNELRELYLLRVEFVCSEAFERRLLRGLLDIVEAKPDEERTLEGLVEDFAGEWLWFRSDKTSGA